MGMYDSVILICPHCDKSVELQSKAGDCTLARYLEDEIPAEIAVDLKNSNDSHNTYCYGEVMSKHRVLVVAGTYKQFEGYVRDRVTEATEVFTKRNGVYIVDNYEYKFVVCNDSIRGLRDWSIVFTGTWYSRTDILEIVNIASANQLKGIEKVLAK